MGRVGVVLGAVGHGSSPAAALAGALVEALADRHGVPFVLGGHPNIVAHRANYTGGQTDTALVTVGSGTKVVVTRCSALVDNAVSVDVAVRVGFGASATPTGDGVVLSHPGIVSGSGVVEGAGSGILGVGADGEDLRVTCGPPTGGSVDVLVSYFTIES